MNPAAPLDGAATSAACAADMPLVPPSPYKPGARPVRPRPSTLPSLFANKMGILSAMDDGAAKDRDAVRQVEHMMARRAIPFQARIGSAKTESIGSMSSPFTSAGASMTTAATLSSEEKMSLTDVMVDQEARARAESMQITLFFVVKHQQLEAQESTARTEIVAEEDHTSLITEMAFLERRQELLAETLSDDKAPQLAMLQRDKIAREAEREATLRLIETEVARESLERRVGEALRRRIEMLLPQYLTERRAIEDEEAEGLRMAFQWHAKNRPLGPGCFIKGPEEDPRLRYGSLSRTRKSTAAQARQIASAKARSLTYREQLRDRSGTAVVAMDGDNEAEMCYANEGRRLLQDEKMRLHEHIRRTRALEYLVEEEQQARVEVQHEEAQAYVPIAAFGVDDLYQVRALNHEQKLERERARELVVEQEEAADDDAALRAFIRAQLAREQAEADALMGVETEETPLQITAVAETV